MTARLIFEATLIELSKVLAPALKLYEFNYLFNKAINQYINKVYNVYDINQQTTDDLRVLKSTAYLTPKKYWDNNKAYNNALGSIPIEPSKKQGIAISYLSKSHPSIQSIHGATYEVEMPMDYLHMLNCVCIYYVALQKDCWDAGSFIAIPATRLTADSWSQIITDIYNRPSPMKPYYYIHNVNSSNDLPTNPYNSGDGTDMNGIYNVTTNGTWEIPPGNDNGTQKTPVFNAPDNETSNFSRTFKLNNTDVSAVEKPIASRIGNASKVRCEIRYGKDDTVFQLVEVLVDYVKVPQHIRLTQEQLDLTMDTSQIMEFPDYVNQEIINELVHLVMTRTSDPILPNHVLITLSIARPTGQLQQPQAQA